MIDDIEIKSTSNIHAALASPIRLRILLWLMDPRSYFPEQQDGDLVDDGVCVGFITEKTGLTQPTISAHMKKLTDTGLVRGKRIGNWVFYRPEREVVARLGDRLQAAASRVPSKRE